jgi:hypothetical protein
MIDRGCPVQINRMFKLKEKNLPYDLYFLVNRGGIRAPTLVPPLTLGQSTILTHFLKSLSHKEHTINNLVFEKNSAIFPLCSPSTPTQFFIYVRTRRNNRENANRILFKHQIVVSICSLS